MNELDHASDAHTPLALADASGGERKGYEFEQNLLHLSMRVVFCQPKALRRFSKTLLTSNFMLSYLHTVLY